ncbi:hypothetical protein [Ancylobacter mangrovi]|uniref:hypothetical protein n=1 Tax=Ancylobacter mangrovi TaxID=2972472 RepID=UPI002163DBDC|nr:hypothetical protein [Ancylobacter mangrovi]MCS0501391.1 hypothetical protein [Ancylobacter mangrovi]
MAKTDIDIEDLLVWAYRDELPKAQVEPVSFSRGITPGWAGMSKFGKLLAVVDEGDIRNRYGVVPDRSATEGPHADAEAVAQAVEGLENLSLEIPGGWWPFADWASPERWGEAGQLALRDVLDRICVVDESGVRRFKTSPAWLVRKHAMIASAPDWEAEPPTYRTVKTRTGQNAWFVKRTITLPQGGEYEVEQDGFNPTRRRPYRDAYMKMELVPSPFYAGVDRAEYEVWHAGLTLLAEELGNRLASRFVVGPRRSARPWEQEDVAQGRILQAFSGVSTAGA